MSPAANRGNKGPEVADDGGNKGAEVADDCGAGKVNKYLSQPPPAVVQWRTQS